MAQGTASGGLAVDAPPHIYRASDLAVAFPAGWAVRRFDEHAFFRALGGHHKLSAVDFVALAPPGHRGALVEVKSYLPRGRHAPGLPPPDLLADKLARKRRDTLAALERIGAHYVGRGWWRWLVRPGLRRVRDREARSGGTVPGLDYDYRFFPLLAEAAAESAYVIVLEGPSPLIGAYRARVAAQLSARGVRAAVVGAADLRAALSEAS